MNTIVRYRGTLWRVDNVRGEVLFLRPLCNAYGAGCVDALRVDCAPV